MKESLVQLRDRLLKQGNEALTAPRRQVPFTHDFSADKLMNDLEGHPHAFLFGCLVDRQVPAEQAWLVPSLIRQRLRSFEFKRLERLSEARWRTLMRKPAPAHRYPELMAKVLYRATQRLRDVYEGEASRIWRNKPSSASLVLKFLEFYGAGPKIATMAANILVREFHVRLSDYRYIDISADVQVSRVMARLGFIDQSSKPEIAVYAARDLNPTFPGIFDLILWRIGRDLCRPQAPLCDECPLSDLCYYASNHKVN